MKNVFSKISLYICCLLPFLGFANDHPFSYDLHLTRIEGSSSKTMVCLHGMGGNYTLVNYLKSIGVEERLVSFNFPDYDFWLRPIDPQKISFGSIKEILPVVYVLKKLIVEEGLNEINLYGYSAGGGAIINTMAALNDSAYDLKLREIGVTTSDKKEILAVLQRGYIILEVPLKSVREVIDFRNSDQTLKAIAENYLKNRMEPIDMLEKLSGLSLNIIVHFEKPDEVLSNRDDDLYIERLKKYNKLGRTKAIVGKGAGHNGHHADLWNYYLSISSIDQ